MRRTKLLSVLGPGALFASMAGIVSTAFAGDVAIVHARFQAGGNGWSVDVTLRHGDTGWDHYADAWRVVAEDGTVLATRTLYHPHENEQPFTRGLGSVPIPADAKRVYVEAHDKVHGWSPQRLRIDLDRAQGEGYEVSR